jgi:hypothetical protein
VKASSWTAERAAGLLLVAGLLIGLLAVPIMIFSGALPGFSASLQGRLADLAPYAGTFRLLILLYTLAWIVQLLGLALFARRLAQAGAETTAILAFTLIALASLLGVVHGAFNGGVMTWAAETAARTGSVPAGYAALDVWVSSAFGLGYRAHLLAIAGLGWAIVRTGLLAPALGWATIGWSLLCLVGVLAGVGAPGLVFLMPAAIGAAMLLRSDAQSARATAEPAPLEPGQV